MVDRTGVQIVIIPRPGRPHPSLDCASVMLFCHEVRVRLMWLTHTWVREV